MMRRRDFLRVAGLGVAGLALMSPVSWADSFEVPQPGVSARRRVEWMHGDPRLGCASLSPAQIEPFAVQAFAR
jgi:hypothetical protein